MQQNYSFAPPNMGVGTDKKSKQVPLSYTTAYSPPAKLKLTESLDFVFVDEHNRHKRLKGAYIIRIPG